jgi:hypothetical protein
VHPSGRKSCANDTQPPIYAAWAQDVREVPDMLVAAQLSLRSLARDEATASSAEAKRIVGEACDLLRVALVNIVQVTQEPAGLPSGSCRGQCALAFASRSAPRPADVIAFEQ